MKNIKGKIIIALFFIIVLCFCIFVPSFMKEDCEYNIKEKTDEKIVFSVSKHFGDKDTIGDFSTTTYNCVLKNDIFYVFYSSYDTTGDSGYTNEEIKYLTKEETKKIKNYINHKESLKLFNYCSDFYKIADDNITLTYGVCDMNSRLEDYSYIWKSTYENLVNSEIIEHPSFIKPFRGAGKTLESNNEKNNFIFCDSSNNNNFLNSLLIEGQMTKDELIIFKKERTDFTQNTVTQYKILLDDDLYNYITAYIKFNDWTGLNDYLKEYLIKSNEIKTYFEEAD